MKFAISTAFLSFAGLVSSANIAARQFCAEAVRFGVLSVSSPTGASSFNAGDDIAIKVDLNCAVNHFNIVPRFLDYAINVPASVNNGHEPDIVLARRTLPAGALSDSFTTKIPHGFFFAGAAYQVIFTNTYPINGTDGSEVLIQEGMLQPITINT
ncbi:hypothetical protein GALMADRAFT_235291 [Galerina marginata CBS 339.88]|uniref:Phosphatidylglycerol/phosphatidylinositol transfer protein n=1 Tax=Galerina marginata (strain CBS 339.88) TaxID=685588 RepID=A0A067TUR2_GALM3|nr:hypothetical protein GALMADRAFT_235291 [Galerina marginata CBS 339.88]